MQLCRCRFTTIRLGIVGSKRALTSLGGSTGSRDAAAPLPTASPLAKDGGTAPRQTSCHQHLEQFLGMQLCTGRSDASAMGQTAVVQSGLAQRLSACIATYTDQQHGQILSKLEQARRDQYVQLSTSVNWSSMCAPIVLAYTSMLEQVTVSKDPKAIAQDHMSRNLRLAVEILHPPGAVCWPWPSRASSCPQLVLGADKQAAAQALIHVMRVSFTPDAWANMPPRATTDALKAMALCGHATDTDTASELITHGGSYSSHVKMPVITVLKLRS